MSKWLRTIVPIAFSVLFLAFLADLGLRLLGYPSEPALQITHPANYEEQRNSDEFSYHFRTNALGLRYHEIEPTPATNETRVFVVGDSFVEGYGVEVEQRFTDLLEKYFNAKGDGRQYSFINAGLSGRGPIQYYRIFDKIGLNLKPAVLLIGVMANDPHNTPAEFRLESLNPETDPPKRSSLKAALHAVLPRTYTILFQAERSMLKTVRHGSVVDQMIGLARERGIDESHISGWRHALSSRLVADVNKGLINPSVISGPLLEPDAIKQELDVESPVAKQRVSKMIAVLDALVSLARAHGVRPALLFFPSRYQWEPRAFEITSHPAVALHTVRREWLTAQTELQLQLQRWAARQHLPSFDVTETLRAAGDDGEPLAFPIDGHWTPAGHRRVATAVEDWIEREGVLAP